MGEIQDLAAIRALAESRGASTEGSFEEVRSRISEYLKHLEAEANEALSNWAKPNPWKSIPEGSPKIDGVRFLLGRHDRCEDGHGTIATGYWSEEHKFWAWPYDVKPTMCKELAPFRVPDPGGSGR